jgi:glycosyltransferase involved in cell wall biosynthesis
VKPTILIVADWYLPGYKAGGLITALANLVDFIGDTFELYIFTRDRDLTDINPYALVRSGQWQALGKARVQYASDLSFSNLRKSVFDVRPNVIYLNSFFSILTVKILCLRKLGLLPKSEFVLAPRGECSLGALKIKSLKKVIYRNVALRTGIYRGLVWQASSELEAKQIANFVRAAGQEQPCICVAWDLPSRNWMRATENPPTQTKLLGARFFFMARISPVKNLRFALDALAKLKGNVQFDIFGPIDDDEYWSDCQKRMKFLPRNVIARYRGMITRELIPRVALDYDFFVLPTQGENFGYAILEAMAAGCPVILSDRTPWRDLTERGVGWALPLEDCGLWHRTLQECVDMAPEAYAAFSSRAREYVQAWSISASQRGETMQLFNLALDRNAKPDQLDSLRAPSPAPH